MGMESLVLHKSGNEPRNPIIWNNKEADLMGHTSSKNRMDEALGKLEEDYLDAVDNNQSNSVEAFVEAFLHDSWSYNERNLATIKTAMSRYSQQQIDVDTFSSSFQRMVDRVQEKLQGLDEGGRYPVIQEGRGASLMIAFVDSERIYVSLFDVRALCSEWESENDMRS